MRNPEPAAYDDALRASETVDPRLVRHWGRLEYTPPRPTADALLVAFTAPHSIPVARDGDAAHKVEHHTWALAREFARGVAEHGAGGADGAAASPPFAAACVRWSRAERRRTRTRADPTNRDPNFLRDDEMLASPWLLALRDARARVAPPSAPALHVDVHGISDRDRETDACRPDVMAGTAAMARREAAAGAAAAPATARFRERLEAALLPVLLDARWALDYSDGERAALGLDAALHAGGGRTRAPALAGDWEAYGESARAAPGRNTLTQMSTDARLWLAAGGARQRDAPRRFTHAVQLELSARLRERMSERAPFAAAFGAALARAFADACRPPPVPCALSPSAHATSLETMRRAAVLHRHFYPAWVRPVV